MFCLMSSCALFRGSARHSLLGEWRYVDRVQSCHYVFNDNGLFAGEVTLRAKLVSKFTGRWSVEGKTILYTYLSDALGRIPAGAKDRDKLLSIQKDSFVIEAADGSQRRYSRIK
ncbi:MAG: hypothetical protein QOG51_1469 [Verrucomicrobiota bacterium]